MPTDAEEIAQLKAEVGRLTDLVNGLYKHLGIGQAQAQALMSNEPPAEMIDAIRNGQKIVAIKLQRERTGEGLAEAKLYVEELARQYGL
jgi:ribosomal protein L7/L12